MLAFMNANEREVHANAFILSIEAFNYLQTKQ